MTLINKKFSDISVLIAEDNPTVAKTLLGALKKIGCKVIDVVLDGEEAVTAALKKKPDVVLMDIRMPKLDGFEATKRILQHHCIPIIFITAHHSQAFVEKASEAGASAFLTKPPKVKEIKRAITIALARHGDLVKMQKLNKKLQEALAEIKILKDILPICSNCKKIRDDDGYWEQLESYISTHLNTKFSHGICPDCAGKLYPEYVDKVKF